MGKRSVPCPACGRPYDPSRIPPPRVPLNISCACCCPEDDEMTEWRKRWREAEERHRERKAAR